MKKLLALLAVVLASSPAAQAEVTTDGAVQHHSAAAQTWGEWGSASVSAHVFDYFVESSRGYSADALCFSVDTQQLRDYGCFVADSLTLATFDHLAGTARLRGYTDGFLTEDYYYIDVTLTRHVPAIPAANNGHYAEASPETQYLRAAESAGTNWVASAEGEILLYGTVVASFPSAGNNQAEMGYSVFTGAEHLS